MHNVLFHHTSYIPRFLIAAFDYINLLWKIFSYLFVIMFGVLNEDIIFNFN